MAFFFAQNLGDYPLDPRSSEAFRSSVLKWLATLRIRFEDERLPCMVASLF